MFSYVRPSAKFHAYINSEDDEEELYFSVVAYLLYLLYHKDHGPVHLESDRQYLVKQ